ncbi:MAG: hypothetical protein DDT29_02373 [Dehalococcoidia bacterium]|nr:hypothetical protein [Bacillota bacterium]
MAKKQLRMSRSDRITIAGLPGTGKTTLAKFLASLCVPRVLIYDPLAQYNGFEDEHRYIPTSDTAAEFNTVCRRLRAQGNLMFVVEEAERYIGQGRPLGDDAFDLINRGRNWNVGITAVTRRIQRLSKDYFDLCQHVFFFKCGLKSREYISDMIGWADTNKIMKLSKFSFLHYDVEKEESSIRILNMGTITTPDAVAKDIKVEKSIGGGKIVDG